MPDQNLLALLPLLAPVPPLLALVAPDSLADRSAAGSVKICRALMLAALLFALGAVAGLALAGRPLHHEFAAIGPLGLTVYFDAVAAVMLLLVAFLGVAVMAYARNYLAGDPGQGRFMKWLAVTVGSVLLLIVSGNLALFTAAWMATSLSLHKLLTFYPDRPAAMLAARKKYLFSRVGDACLIVALIAAWRQFGTLDYAALFAAAQAQTAMGTVNFIAVLLVSGAVLKSAQFPFHGWLPDTMETPTPVSALMHAGIINAGGYLVIRFSPLIAQAPEALVVLAFIGAVTALFGSLVMITQTSVKRMLAFSTVAQMGFMMLQCGLGAFSLALLHLVAHSLYKAHAFLSSGGLIAAARVAGSPPRQYRGLAGALLVFACAGGLVAGISLIQDYAPWHNPADFALALILTLALAQLLWNWWALGSSPTWILTGVAIAAGVALLSFALHAGAGWCFASSLGAAPTSPVLWPLAAFTILGFLFIALRVFLPPGWVETRFGQAVFVHAYNGFYLNTLANRVVHALWRNNSCSKKS